MNRIICVVVGWCFLCPATAQTHCGNDGQDSCAVHDQADMGQGLLQRRSAKKTADVKEHSFANGDAESSEALIKSNMELVHGIPVYGYHSALPAVNEDGVELLATEADPVNWIIAFSDTATDADVLKFCNDLVGAATCTMTGHPDENGLSFDTLRATKPELQQILAKHPEVRWGEADSLVYAIPDAPQDSNVLLEAEKNPLPWGLDRIDERKRDSTSSYTPSPKSGSGVHVYVFDTGVRTTHAQFEGRAIPTLESYNNVRKVCSPTDIGCAADDNGHGTHCAGTVAGKDYGVAPKATIHAVQVLDRWGSGYTADIVNAIDWVLSKGQKPAVISMSVGGPKHSFHAYKAAIDKATAGGVVVVVAAGNHNDDACRYQPAYVPSAITVGATNVIDQRSGFSNYGTCIDIFAPGTSVMSAGHRSDTDTAVSDGTSMACPHVAGAAALVLGQNPRLSAYNVTGTLINKATSGEIKGIPKTPPSPNKLLYVDATPPVLLPPLPTPTPAPTPTPTPAPTPTPTPGPIKPGKVRFYRAGDRSYYSEMDACPLITEKGGCWNINQIGQGCNKPDCLKWGAYCNAGDLVLPDGVSAEAFYLYIGSDWNKPCQDGWGYRRGSVYATPGLHNPPDKPCAYKFSITDTQKYAC